MDMFSEEAQADIGINDLVLIKVLLPKKIIEIIYANNGEYLDNFCTQNNVHITIDNGEKAEKKKSKKKSDEKVSDNETITDNENKVIQIIGAYSKALIALNMLTVFASLDITIDSDRLHELILLIDDQLEYLLVKNNNEILNIISQNSGAQLRIANKEYHNKCVIIKGVFTANSKACRLLVKLINNEKSIKSIKKSMIDVILKLNNDKNKSITVKETLKYSGFKDADINEILTAFNVLTKFGLLTVSKSNTS